MRKDNARSWLFFLTVLWAAFFAAYAHPATTTAPVTQPTTQQVQRTAPVYVWFQPARNLALMKSLGVTVVCGPEVENASGLTSADLAKKKQAWIDQAAAVGLQVVLKNPTAPLPAHAVGILHEIDEPNGKGRLPAELKAATELYRSKFPGIPIFLSLAGDKVLSANFNKLAEAQLYQDYAAQADVLTINFYSTNRNASRYPTTHTGDIVAKLLTLTGKPVVAWVECNDQQVLPAPKPADGVSRGPTPDEISATVDYALSKGAAGIGWFATCASGKYGWAPVEGKGDSYWPLIDRNGASIATQNARLRDISYVLQPPPVVPTTKPTTQPATQPTLNLAGLRKPRIYIDSNPTPINFVSPDKPGPDAQGRYNWVRNGDLIEQCRAWGWREGFCIYNGTLNRAGVWLDKALKIVPVDFSGVTSLGETERSNPPVEWAVRAITRLAIHAQSAGDGGPNYRPIFFDLEGSPTLYAGPNDTIAIKRAALAKWQTTVGWVIDEAAKDSDNTPLPIFIYGFPFSAMAGPQAPDAFADVRAEESALMKKLSGAALCLYNEDIELASDGAQWFDKLDLMTRNLKDVYPNAPRVAFVHPAWLCNWPQNFPPEMKAKLAKVGKPIELELWKKQIDALVAAGWDIHVWAGGLPLDQYRAHIDYVNSLR